MHFVSDALSFPTLCDILALNISLHLMDLVLLHDPAAKETLWLRDSDVFTKIVLPWFKGVKQQNERGHECTIKNRIYDFRSPTRSYFFQSYCLTTTLRTPMRLFLVCLS